MSEEQKTAADAMVELLVDRWGVRHIFGMPGDGINALVEALRKRQKDVQFIQTRHEEVAAFAAVGYAKFSGRLGVCISTTGPGAVHLLNGLYDAKMDQVPVLAITGLQFHDLLGQDYQQDVNTDRLMMDVAVYTERVMGPAHVDSVTNRAARFALARRGVAHIAFPADFQEEPMSAAKYSQNDQPNHTSTDFRTPVVTPLRDDLQRAADVLNAGKKVAILIGSGARGARGEVEELAELLGAPVAKALLGKDVLPDDSPFTTGSIGPIGTNPTQEAMSRADTFLMVGTSFPYVSYLPKTDGSVRGVQIDINPERIGLRFPVEVGLVGGARETLRALLPLLQRKADRSFLEGIQREMETWRQTMAGYETSADMPMKPQVIARALSERLDDDAILCGDSGSSALWIARDVDLRARQRFSVSGLLASMACGLPYAIGAQVAFPDRQVVAFVGDGALSMLPGDLATLVKYRLPVKVIVLKNNALGFIRWEQMMYAGNPEYGVELADIDFVKVAEGFGVKGLRVERPEEAATVARALEMPGPVVVEAVIDPYEPFLPGSVKQEQARSMASALTEGESNAQRVAGGVYEYAMENVPQTRDTVVGALQGEDPQLLSRAEEASSSQEGEPDESMREQRETAPERQS